MARLSALYTGRLYHQEITLVLISVRGWIDPRAIVRPKGSSQWKVLPMTPLRIEPVTFWLVLKCVNQRCHQVPSHCIAMTKNTIKMERMWKSLCPNLRYQHGICKEVLHKTTNSPSQNILCLGWDVNLWFPAYDSATQSIMAFGKEQACF